MEHVGAENAETAASLMQGPSRLLVRHTPSSANPCNQASLAAGAEASSARSAPPSGLLKINQQVAVSYGTRQHFDSARRRSADALKSGWILLTLLQSQRRRVD